LNPRFFVCTSQIRSYPSIRNSLDILDHEVVDVDSLGGNLRHTGQLLVARLPPPAHKESGQHAALHVRDQPNLARSDRQQKADELQIQYRSIHYHVIVCTPYTTRYTSTCSFLRAKSACRPLDLQQLRHRPVVLELRLPHVADARSLLLLVAHDLRAGSVARLVVQAPLADLLLLGLAAALRGRLHRVPFSGADPARQRQRLPRRAAFAAHHPAARSAVVLLLYRRRQRRDSAKEPRPNRAVTPHAAVSYFPPWCQPCCTRLQGLVVVSSSRWRRSAVVAARWRAGPRAILPADVRVRQP
jgi:hypothetical protein